MLQEVKRRFPDGLPLLDPIEDMGIKDDGLKTVIRVCISPIALTATVVIDYWSIDKLWLCL